MKSVFAAALLCLSMPVWGDTYLVLPFFNASRAANLDWIGESVSECIREALTSGGLVTLGRDDRQEGYRRLGLRTDARLTRATVIKIGQALDAEQVIYGDFDFEAAPEGAKSRGSLKITAHVLNLRGMRQGPEFTEIGSLEDLAVEQARVAWQALQYINPDRALSEDEFLQHRPPVRVAAMENYIRGLLVSSQDQKQRLFTQAVRLQPGYSQAAYQLGLLAYAHLEYKTAAEWLDKVSPSDPQYRQASFYLGICRYEAGDFAGAGTAFALVAKTVPLNEVLNNLGAAQSRQNRPEAIENFIKALEGDPRDPVYQFNVGYALWRQQKFEAAAERFRAALARDPQDPEATTLLGKCLKHTGPAAADTERLERIKTTYEESAYWQLKAVLQHDKP